MGRIPTLGITVPVRLPDGTKNPEYGKQYRALRKASGNQVSTEQREKRKAWAQTPAGQACLAKRKEWRQSPEGKAYVKAFNASPAGKAAVARYHAKLKTRRRAAPSETPDEYAARIILEVEGLDGEE
jgi:DNA-binding PadR family transcriptional regulator